MAKAGAKVDSRAACSWIAATTFGCWWPMLVLTSCAGEVQVAVAVVVPEVRALGAGDGERVDQLLRGPGVEDVRAVGGLDPVLLHRRVLCVAPMRCHLSARDVTAHGFVVGVAPPAYDHRQFIRLLGAVRGLDRDGAGSTATTVRGAW